MFHFSLPAVAQTGQVSLDFSSLAQCCLPRGAEFGTDCGNNRKTSSCVSFSFFCLEQHYCSLKSQNTSSLVLLRVQMVPVIWPEFPVDVRLYWAQTSYPEPCFLCHMSDHLCGLHPDHWPPASHSFLPSAAWLSPLGQRPSVNWLNTCVNMLSRVSPLFFYL